MHKITFLPYKLIFFLTLENKLGNNKIAVLEKLKLKMGNNIGTLDGRVQAIYKHI